MPRYTIFVFAALMVAATPAVGPKKACEVCLRPILNSLIEDYHALEASYVRFRWEQAKIRKLYYEDLWDLRNRQVHPVNKPLRKAAAKDEAVLEKLIRAYESRSDQFANRFFELLVKFESVTDPMNVCCREQAFLACLDEHYAPLRDRVHAAREQFAHILEREKEIMTDVLESVAGPKGIYRTDALEISDSHYDLYSRYEQEREPERYREDIGMMDAFHGLYEFLHLSQSKWERCCLHCAQAADRI